MYMSLLNLFPGGLTKTVCPNYARPPGPVLPYDESLRLKQIDASQASSASGLLASSSAADSLSSSVPTSSSASSNSASSSDHARLSKLRSIRTDTMQMDECCACGSATYRLTFRGVWNRKTHPRDWPIGQSGLLHWTNLIGASHMAGFSLYRPGEPASAGVQSVCMYGDTTVLRQQLALVSSNSDGISGVPTGTQRGAYGLTPLHRWASVGLDESQANRQFRSSSTAKHTAAMKCVHSISFKVTRGLTIEFSHNDMIRHDVFIKFHIEYSPVKFSYQSPLPP
ncbi:unnamed protein product [Protopolystoma xenopodis]|uniref:Spondin domain-containing protein n=1 Tax=Protopolystoma xenopodis TaxID=117903 RepID=A0A3S5BCA9_9PLAT|nr:unnamed protein product [Protopolystoma xenopodis]